ncbi:hypothetical protein KPL70_021064 [Citrus sinensis]|nr:hypothetical protein KPL70_021064 [Citrus sinensis]
MRKYKYVEFQFDPEIEGTARRLRKERRELQAVVAMDDLQDMRNLNPREEVQPVNVHEGLNGQQVQGQSGNNNVIHMANDRDRAIRDCAVLTPQAIHLGIVRPDVQADNFELKLMMFQMLQTVGQFNGLPSEDLHLHLKLFLEVSDTFKIAGASQEALRLILFPFSLRDRARAWLNSLPPDSITTWNDLADKFLMKYFPPTKNAKLRNEITSFINLKMRACMMHGKDLRSYSKDVIIMWPSTRQAAARGTTGVHNVDVLTALSAQVTSLINMVKAITTAPATVNQVAEISCVYCGGGHLFDNCPGNPTSVNYVDNFNRQNQDNPYSNIYNPGWRQHPNFSWSYQNQTAEVPSGQNILTQPPGFYQQNQEQISINNDQLSSLEALIKDYIVKNEAVVQSHAASLRNLENQIGQLATAVSNRPQGSLPSNTENPRREGKEHCKVINLRSGKENANQHSSATASAKSYDPAPGGEEATTPIATDPSRAKEKQSAQPATAQQFRHPPPFLKDILTKKRRLGEFETIALTQECSRMLQSKIPQKMKDPRSFTIPCSIGTKYSGKALCDLGANIKLMPLSVFKQLGVGECRPTTVTLQLADRSHAYPEGKIEDVLVKSPDEIEDCNFISVVDFVVVERLHSCCSKEEINVVTFEELNDEDRGAANIAWSGEKQLFRIDEQIQQRELTPDQQEFKVNGPKVKHYMGDYVNSLKNDWFLKDPG